MEPVIHKPITNKTPNSKLGNDFQRESEIVKRFITQLFTIMLEYYANEQCTIVTQSAHSLFTKHFKSILYKLTISTEQARNQINEISSSAHDKTLFQYVIYSIPENYITDIASKTESRFFTTSNRAIDSIVKWSISQKFWELIGTEQEKHNNEKHIHSRESAETITTLKEYVTQLLTEIEQLKSQLKESEKTHSQTTEDQTTAALENKSQVEKLKTQIEQFKSQLNELEKLNTQIEQLQSQLKESDQTTAELENKTQELEKLNTKIEQLQSQLKESEITHSQTTAELEKKSQELNTKYNEKIAELENKSQRLNEAQNKLKNLKTQNEQLNKNLDKAKETINNYANTIRFSTLFADSDVISSKQDTEYLVTEIEQYINTQENLRELADIEKKQLKTVKPKKVEEVKTEEVEEVEPKKVEEVLPTKKIVGTKCIYRYDPLNTTSFHKYIDEIPNIVILVKTKTKDDKDWYIGSYSASPLSSKNAAGSVGILVSPTLVSEIISGKRSITHDNYFLIFGNSEIRIKQGENKVFSNFAIANGFFNPKGKTINDLLNHGKEREIKFITYEVHKVIFE